MTTRSPRQVFLFSGHMIDALDRQKRRLPPRFPPEKEPLAADAIAKVLDEAGAGSQDLGITEGACGGDLLFCEAMLQRGCPLDLFLPFTIDKFRHASVTFAKSPTTPDRWGERFDAVIGYPAVSLSIMVGEKYACLSDEELFKHCNQWMLDCALEYGPERLLFICLWNGGGGDGPGGTAHMVQEVRNRGGRTYWLDTTKIWSIPTQ